MVTEALKVLCIVFCTLYSVQILRYCCSIVKIKVNRHLAYVILIAGVFLIGMFGFFDLAMPVTYLVYAFFITIFYKVAFKIGWLHLTFIVNSYIFHLMVLRNIVLALFSIRMNINIFRVLSDRFSYFLSLSIAYAIACLFITLFRRLYAGNKLVLLMRSRTQLKLLVGAQTLLNLALFGATSIAYVEFVSIWFPVYHLFSSILILLVFYLIFDYAANASRTGTIAVRAQVLEEQLEKQLQHYRQMSEYMTSLRKLKHDYQSLVGGVSRLIELGDTDKALAFVQDMQGQMVAASGDYKIYSNQPFVQAIMTDVAERCRGMSIDFRAEVGIPQGFAMKDVDLCRLFSNMLSNAVEACELMPEGDTRYIIITGTRKGSWFTLTVENSYDGKLRLSGDRMMTRKNDDGSHGFGIDNISEIALRYGGMLQCDPDPTKRSFTAKVHLPC